MVFEYAEGGTLQSHLSRHFNNLTWKDKYKLGLDITKGLDHLHELGIIHKDLVILLSISNLIIRMLQLLSHCFFTSSLL